MSKFIASLIILVLFVSASPLSAAELVFSGSIKNKQGEPVKNCRFSFERTGSRLKASQVASDRYGEVKSDSQGNFKIVLDSKKALSCSMVIIAPNGAVVGGYGRLDESRHFNLTRATTPLPFRARVIWSDEKSKSESARMTLSLFYRNSRTHLLTRTIDSNKSGEFYVKDLPRGVYEIRASTDALVHHTERYTHTKGVGTLKLGFERGGALYGTVRDTAGKPLADIGLTIAGNKAKTDVAGRYTFPCLKTGEDALSVESKVYSFEHNVPSTVVIEPGHRIKKDLVLYKNGGFILKLYSAAEAFSFPEQITVRLFKRNSYQGGYRALKAVFKSGSYTFNNIAPGVYDLSLESAELPNITDEIVILSERKNMVELEIADSFSVAGTVTADGKPLKDAKISFLRKYINTDQYKGVSSDENGSFVVYGLLPGEYEFRIRHKDTNDYSREILINSNIGGFNIDLRRGNVIKGRIVDIDGKPIARASVKLEPDGYVNHHFSRSARTNVNGSFTFRGISSASLSFYINDGKYAPQKLSRIITDDYTFAEPIILHRGFTVSGRVVDEAGRACDKIVVKLTKPDTGYEGEITRSAQTNSEGFFEVHGLPAKEYELRIDNKDFVEYTRELKVEADTEIDNPIVLKAGLSVSGHVLTSQGTPATGYRVYVHGPASDNPDVYTSRHAITQKDGSFSIDGLSSGKLALEVRNEHEMVLQTEVRAGTHNINLTLAARHNLLGVVVDDDGTPIEGVKITVKDKMKGGDRFESNTDAQMSNAEGEFILNVQMDKVYRIAAVKQPYRETVFTLDLSKREATLPGVVKLQMQKGYTIAGSLIYKENGLPAEGIAVSSLKDALADFISNYSERKRPLQCVTDAGGNFVLEGLPAGISTLEFYADIKPLPKNMRPLLSKTINVAETEHLALELPSFGTLQIELKNFKVAPAISLQSEDRQRNYYNLNSDDSTTLIVTGPIITGDYEVQTGFFSYSGLTGLLNPQPVTIEAGKQTEIVIDFNEPPAGMVVSGSATLQGKPFISGNIDIAPKIEVEPNTSVRSNDTLKRVRIDGGGKFEIKGLQAGAYRYTIVDATVGGSETRHTFNGEFHLKENQEELAIDVVGFSLSGTVLSSKQRPVARAGIQLVPRGRYDLSGFCRATSMYSNAEGHFSFTGVGAGQYVIIAGYYGEVATKELTIDGDTSGIDIALADSIQVSGSIGSEHGDDLAGLRLSLLSHHEQRTSLGYMEQDSNFIFSGSFEKNRAYTLFASAPGYALYAVTFKPMKDRVENIVLVPGGSARIKIVSKNGAVANRQIELQDEWGRRTPHRIGKPLEWFNSGAQIPLSSSRGYTTVTGLLPGTYTASIEGVEATQQFNVTALETVEVEFTID